MPIMRTVRGEPETMTLAKWKPTTILVARLRRVLVDPLRHGTHPTGLGASALRCALQRLRDWSLRRADREPLRLGPHHYSDGGWPTHWRAVQAQSRRPSNHASVIRRYCASSTTGIVPMIRARGVAMAPATSIGDTGSRINAA